MPVELLERDQILGTIMPGHGEPPPDGNEAEPDDDSDTDEEPEGEPS